jgi:hypothetical protein
VKAGKFLQIPPRSSRRWALGESRIPASVSMLLRLMIAMKLSPDDVTKAIE